MPSDGPGKDSHSPKRAQTRHSPPRLCTNSAASSHTQVTALGARPVLERAVAACTAVGDTERTRAARSTLSHLGKPKKPLICDETPPPGPGEQFDVTEAIETIAGGAPKTLCLVADPVWRALFGVDRDPT